MPVILPFKEPRAASTAVAYTYAMGTAGPKSSGITTTIFSAKDGSRGMPEGPRGEKRPATPCGECYMLQRVSEGWEERRAQNSN